MLSKMTVICDFIAFRLDLRLFGLFKSKMLQITNILFIYSFSGFNGFHTIKYPLNPIHIFEK